MGKKTSKRRKQGHPVIPAGAPIERCPECGVTKDEKSILALVDQLFRSHAELCAGLRSAGRQLLRVEKQGAESLENIRKALKRAEHVRKALANVDQWPDPLENLHKSIALSASEFSLDLPANHDSARQGVQKANRLNRSYSPRIIRFPAS